jgi:hypothetical protein
MQIVGNRCKVCGREIVFSTDGRFCARCETVVHLRCESGPNCDICGQPLCQEESPGGDILGRAILPAALRPVRSNGPMLPLLLIVVSALVFLIVLLFME